MSECENLDGQCGASWCNCDEIRKRNAAPIPKEIIVSLLAYLDDLPENWDNYNGHWKSGYNQCRNKVAWLLTGKTPNDVAEPSNVESSPTPD